MVIFISKLDKKVGIGDPKNKAKITNIFPFQVNISQFCHLHITFQFILPWNDVLHSHISCMNFLSFRPSDTSDYTSIQSTFFCCIGSIHFEWIQYNNRSCH